MHARKPVFIFRPSITHSTLPCSRCFPFGVIHSVVVNVSTPNSRRVALAATEINCIVDIGVVVGHDFRTIVPVSLEVPNRRWGRNRRWYVVSVDVSVVNFLLLHLCRRPGHRSSMPQIPIPFGSLSFVCYLCASTMMPVLRIRD